jgi:hypothetical protein
MSVLEQVSGASVKAERPPHTTFSLVERSTYGADPSPRRQDIFFLSKGVGASGKEQYFSETAKQKRQNLPIPPPSINSKLET